MLSWLTWLFSRSCTPARCVAVLLQHFFYRRRSSPSSITPTTFLDDFESRSFFGLGRPVLLNLCCLKAFELFCVSDKMPFICFQNQRTAWASLHWFSFGFISINVALSLFFWIVRSSQSHSWFQMYCKILFISFTSNGAILDSIVITAFCTGLKLFISK